MKRFILGNDYSRKCAVNAVLVAPAGYICEVREPRRTSAQNDLLWALLSSVSRAKPDGRQHTPDVWKCLFMQACGYAVQFEVGLDGSPFPLGFRSSKMTKSQMTDLIEFILQYCAEKGIEVDG